MLADGNPQVFDALHGHDGHQLLTAGQGQAHLGIDRAGLNVTDLAFEYVACTDFHGKHPLLTLELVFYQITCINAV
ncbi:hypothetical protein D3C76_1819150 [compost metagenome]